MRKTILTIAALLATLAAGAQTFVSTMDDDWYVIPPQLTSDGQGRLIFDSSTYSNENSADYQMTFGHFTILDNQLQVNATITFTPTFYSQITTYESFAFDRSNTPIKLRYYDYACFPNRRSGNYHWDFFYFTQTLFNNNADYEYLLCNWDGTFSISYTSDYNGEQYTHTYSKCEAISIMNANGDEVGTIELPEGYAFDVKYLRSDEPDMISASVIKMGDVTYLVFPVMSMTDAKQAVAWYRVNSATNSVTLVRTIPMSVHPSVAERGQEITVELGEGSQATELKVVDAQGRTLKRVSVQPGQREVRIPTADLGRGMHFVDSPNQGAAKVILR